MNLLACDLGGTKTILGIYENNNKNVYPKLIFKEKYSSQKWSSLYSILDDFFHKMHKDIRLPKKACFAIAGAIKDDFAKITNLNWLVSSTELQNKYDFEEIEIINDFEVMIYGIPFINKIQYEIIQEGKTLDKNQIKFHTFVGAGTGLGVSRGILSKEGIQSFPSEAGHIEFSPRSFEEWELKNWIIENLNLERVSSERIISGEGLSLIANWILSKPIAHNHFFNKNISDINIKSKPNKINPSEICSLSDKGDQLMQKVQRIWLDAYASFLGDIAIHELCFGGLWISGGTAPKHIKNFRSASFLKQFSNKGRLTDIVKSIPVKVIIDEEFGLLSAACRARMLQKT